MKLYNGVLYVGFIITILGIYEFFLNDFIFKSYIRSDYLVTLSDVAYSSYRIRTFFYHPIVYANFLVILFCINNFVNKSTFSKMILNLLIISNLIMTQTRSAWISFILIVIILYIRNKFILNKNENKKRSINPYLKLALISLASIFLINLAFLFSDYFVEVYSYIMHRVFDLQSSYGAISFYQRFFAFVVIFHEVFMNIDFPHMIFGHGLGTSGAFMKTQQSYISGFATTDNTYLDILYDSGIVGLILIIWLHVFLVAKFVNKNASNFFICNYLIFIATSINLFFYSILGWDIIIFFYLLSLSFMLIEIKIMSKVTRSNIK
ncbi:oligosaccharide repeat unit polymerase [Peribacillus frigoritolerans]|uniref:O-antigen ligase family protein n=1 Tax=Peribacillus frigoritolerans TaxID=450367 RepID=UPI0021D27336|nr:O-antigen polymerase [Peribacillus frigoritolerans]MCU6600456.1 oligosaccharide repeat unit polymerase [Peribacillus frigoritolerans]